MTQMMELSGSDRLSTHRFPILAAVRHEATRGISGVMEHEIPPFASTFHMEDRPLSNAMREQLLSSL